MDCTSMEFSSEIELSLERLKKQVLEIYAELGKANEAFTSDLKYGRDMYVNTELLRPMDVKCMIEATRDLIETMRKALDHYDQILPQLHTNWLCEIKYRNEAKKARNESCCSQQEAVKKSDEIQFLMVESPTRDAGTMANIKEDCQKSYEWEDYNNYMW